MENGDWGFLAIAFFAVAFCIVAWAAIIERMCSGKSVLPYQPRRRVPWQVWDMLAVSFFYIFAITAAIFLLRCFLPLAAIESANDPSLRKMSAANPVVQLLAMKNWATLLLGGASVIIIAPVAEEFFFRVLLQGWLEKVERAWRRRLPTFRRWMPSAAGPVLISSFVFASQHFRKQAPVVDLDVFTLLLACDGIIKIISIIFTVLFLRWRVGATAADLGWAPENILPDLRLGLVTFAAILVPIYGSVIVASQLLSKEFAPDPISIFFFAIALGLLYNRTHRAAPSIALHMALNATSLAMFYLGSAG